MGFNIRAFSVIELIIIIVILGILITIGAVNLSSSLVLARDDERKNDIQSISITLEGYYTSKMTLPSYPSTEELTNNETAIVNSLKNVDIKIFRAPGVSDAANTFTVASNNTTTTAGVTPQPTIAQYVYQPLQASGALCTLITQTCERYNLFYRLEGDNTVYKLSSKNQ